MGERIGIYSEDEEIVTWIYMPRGILHGVYNFGTQKAIRVFSLVTRVEDNYRAIYALGFRWVGIYRDAP